MRRDSQIAILLGFAAIPAGVALMAAPYYAEAILKAYASKFFWGGLLVTILLLSAAIAIAARGEKTEPRLGRRRRMIALGGMIVCALGFVGFAAAYFWPSRHPGLSVSSKMMPLTSEISPDLHLSLLGGNVFTGDSTGWTGLSLEAQVWNTGGPTVATEWSLTITPKSALPIEAQFTKMPENMSLRGTSGNTEFIRSDESLEAKTSSTAIEMLPLRGRLLFYVTLPRTIVLAPDTELKLSVKDVYGKETSAVQRMGNWLQRNR